MPLLGCIEQSKHDVYVVAVSLGLQQEANNLEFPTVSCNAQRGEAVITGLILVSLGLQQ